MITLGKNKKPSFQGVNLGGWLLVERWMTPSLFKDTKAQDEYSLMQTSEGAARLLKHRTAFMTEEDWLWLASNNISYVRLPVGYWVMNDDAPYVNAKKQLDWAFEMAEKYSIHILLDLHALKGSQNGTMHSGKIGTVEWKKYTLHTFKVLKKLALRYKKSPAFWGIEIINEPKVVGNYFALLSYYRKAYKLLRGILKPGTYTVFQDGFVPLLFSGALFARKKFPVIMDTHFYLAFPKLLSWMSPEAYDRFRDLLYGLTIILTYWRQPVIVGEWSSVLPQAMFDKVPKDQHYKMLAGTIARQRALYGKAMGAFYWNYKAEGEGMYNFRSLVDSGSINT
jgi:glucan 1,3-beta-glucosidase